jgi:DNA-binding transcriptional MocR family regulator
VKSLSQITVSGIRLGLMVVPAKLVQKFLYAKFSSDIASFGMMQRCMREFIRQGMFHRHLSKVKVAIDQRRDQLMSVIHTLEDFSTFPNQYGYSLWLKSGRSLPPDPVPWSRGEEFSFAPDARNHFRLSFMHMEDDLFRSGLAYLQRFWSKDADWLEV